MFWVQALSRSGRCRVMVSTCSASSVRISANAMGLPSLRSGVKEWILPPPRRERRGPRWRLEEQVQPSKGEVHGIVRSGAAKAPPAVDDDRRRQRGVVGRGDEGLRCRVLRRDSGARKGERGGRGQQRHRGHGGVRRLARRPPAGASSPPARCDGSGAVRARGDRVALGAGVRPDVGAAARGCGSPSRTSRGPARSTGGTGAAPVADRCAGRPPRGAPAGGPDGRRRGRPRWSAWGYRPLGRRPWLAAPPRRSSARRPGRRSRRCCTS